MLVIVDLIAVTSEVMLEHVCSPTALTEQWARGLGWLSRGVIILIASHTLSLLLVFGWRFFLHPWYVLDLIVIATALALEFSFTARIKAGEGGGATGAEAGGYLTVLLTWRIVRILHALAVSAETEQSEYSGGRRQLPSVERELAVRSSYTCTILPFLRFCAAVSLGAYSAGTGDAHAG